MQRSGYFAIEGKNRAYISFTDSIDVGLRYASLDSKSEENKENSFGVMLGVKTEALEELDAFSVESDVLEIGIMDHIPLEHIKVLIVPKEKVEFVKKLVGEHDIEVVGAEMNDRFYRMHKIGKIEYLMNIERNNQKGMKEYNQNDMEVVAKEAKLSRIMKFFENIKNKVQRKDRTQQYGDDGR